MRFLFNLIKANLTIKELENDMVILADRIRALRHTNELLKIQLTELPVTAPLAVRLKLRIEQEK